MPSLRLFGASTRTTAREFISRFLPRALSPGKSTFPLATIHNRRRSSANNSYRSSQILQIESALSMSLMTIRRKFSPARFVLYLVLVLLFYFEGILASTPLRPSLAAASDTAFSFPESSLTRERGKYIFLICLCLSHLRGPKFDRYAILLFSCLLCLSHFFSRRT